MKMNERKPKFIGTGKPKITSKKKRKALAD